MALALLLFLIAATCYAYVIRHLVSDGEVELDDSDLEIHYDHNCHLAYGASVLIVNDGLVLGVARRSDPNDFGLPGGKRDPGETEIQCATRECYEETGILVWNLKEVLRRDVGPDTGVTFTGDWQGEPHTMPGEPECGWRDPNTMLSGVFGEYNTVLFRKTGLIK